MEISVIGLGRMGANVSHDGNEYGLIEADAEDLDSRLVAGRLHVPEANRHSLDLPAMRHAFGGHTEPPAGR